MAKRTKQSPPTLFELPAQQLTGEQQRLAYEESIFGEIRPKPVTGMLCWVYTGDDYVLMQVSHLSTTGKTYWAFEPVTGLVAMDAPADQFKSYNSYQFKPQFPNK
jgi:hypothetical protein